jgi:hypothetical protein
MPRVLGKYDVTLILAADATDNDVQGDYDVGDDNTAISNHLLATRNPEGNATDGTGPQAQSTPLNHSLLPQEDETVAMYLLRCSNCSHYNMLTADSQGESTVRNACRCL